MSHTQDSGLTLSDEEWAGVQARVPIACVDLVPVVRDHLGAITHVGLIRRHTPFDGEQRWCQIGGRVRRSESLAAAANRHFQDALGLVAFDDSEEDPQPGHVMQWFPDERGDQWGTDPRQHAISLCYLIELPITAQVQARGEALDFAWMPVPGGLPAEIDTWPGTLALVTRLLRSGSTIDSAAYQSLSDRHLSHNEMIWQTPGLAFAGQAFLLSAALAADIPTGGRVLASALSVLVSILTIQLMAKHSALEKRDIQLLEKLDVRFGYPAVHARPPRLPGMAGYQSRLLWQWGFAVIGAGSLLILVSAALGLGWFS